MAHKVSSAPLYIQIGKSTRSQEIRKDLAWRICLATFSHFSEILELLIEFSIKFENGCLIAHAVAVVWR